MSEPAGGSVRRHGQASIARAIWIFHGDADETEEGSFVRRPERLATKPEQLRVFRGSVTDDAPALADAVRAQDAVVSTLGVGNSLKSSGLIARSVPAIVRAMESQGVRRLIFTSAYGVGATRRDVPLLPRIVMRLLLRDI